MRMKLRGSYLRTMITALALMIALAMAGCHSETKPAGNAVKRYALEGKVMDVNLNEHTLTIAHKTIPGFMDAMTMPFTVKDERALRAAHAGDYVHATLVVGEEAWLEDVTTAAGGTKEAK